jgi:two-component system cell cycle sensor histidine kinase/response regulator CckA
MGVPMSGLSTEPMGWAWLQSLFDRSPMAIGFSRDGLMLDANAAYVGLFGYESVGEIRGRPILDQIAVSHRSQISENIAQRARGETVPTYYETRGLRRDGTEFPFAITTTRVTMPEGPLTIAFIADASERENALAAQRSSEERFRTLAAATLEGVFVHADGKVVLANDAGAAMFGFDAASIIGVPLDELTAPEFRAIVADRLKHHDTRSQEGVARRRDGSTFPVEVHARPQWHDGRLSRVAVIRDVTEQRRAEAERRALAEQVQQNQRLQSLGVLAGGVAHDFNNILTVISNGVTLAKRKARSGAPVGEQLDAIELAAARATELCHQMLAYAGKARLERERVELSALVDEMSSMLGASISKKVSLERQLAAGLPVLHADATQVRQIVMNLVLNASEAVLHADGSIRLSTGTGVYGAEAFARSAAGGAPKSGPYVWLEVADDGMGMDPATLERLFDPFFTTKFLGRGLGMAAVLGIVRSHEGAIEVESQKGAGTRVRVFFPVPAENAQVVQPPAGAREAPGEGFVLLVDDEQNVRRSTELLLRDFGFDVVAVADGAEAINVFRAEAARLDAVLLDLSMPRMDGFETLKELRRISADVPVVLMSGFGSLPLQEQPSGGEAPDAMLPKPYRSERLLATLMSVMGR